MSDVGTILAGGDKRTPLIVADGGVELTCDGSTIDPDAYPELARHLAGRHREWMYGTDGDRPRLPDLRSLRIPYYRAGRRG